LARASGLGVTGAFAGFVSSLVAFGGLACSGVAQAESAPGALQGE
jgi:hypothetical protein